MKDYIRKVASIPVPICCLLGIMMAGILATVAHFIAECPTPLAQVMAFLLVTLAGTLMVFTLIFLMLVSGKYIDKGTTKKSQKEQKI